MLFSRAALDLSLAFRRYVAGLVREHRRRIGSRWRALPSERQALLVLVHLRRNETFPPWPPRPASGWRPPTAASPR